MRFRMGDRPKALTTELKEYATRWLKPITQGEREIVDKVVLEQVSYAVPPDVRTWLLRVSPVTLEQPAACLKNYTLAEQSNTHPNWTPSSGKRPHETHVDSGKAMRCRRMEETLPMPGSSGCMRDWLGSITSWSPATEQTPAFNDPGSNEKEHPDHLARHRYLILPGSGITGPKETSNRPLCGINRYTLTSSALASCEDFFGLQQPGLYHRPFDGQ